MMEVCRWCGKAREIRRGDTVVGDDLLRIHVTDVTTTPATKRVDLVCVECYQAESVIELFCERQAGVCYDSVREKAMRAYLEHGRAITVGQMLEILKAD